MNPVKTTDEFTWITSYTNSRNWNVLCKIKSMALWWSRGQQLLQQEKIWKNKGKSKIFIHTKTTDFRGIFIYQNNPIMVTYIFVVRELYNIYKYIYKKEINFCSSSILIVIFFLFIADHIFFMLLTCFVIILCFSLPRRFTFLKAKKKRQNKEPQDTSI